jgi:hypothetical protein
MANPDLDGSYPQSDQCDVSPDTARRTIVLELKLREEFRGRRLKGTTVDFTNQAQTGALQVPAVEFLKITYPSFDLLKTIEATGPDHSRPVVLLGARGQGKSHLMAASTTSAQTLLRAMRG